MELKIAPHSSTVMDSFSEVMEQRGTNLQQVVHLKAQLTKINDVAWTKSNSAMRCGVLTDESGRSLHVTFMAQIAEDFQAEVGRPNNCKIYILDGTVSLWGAVKLCSLMCVLAMTG